MKHIILDIDNIEFLDKVLKEILKKNSSKTILKQNIKILDKLLIHKQLNIIQESFNTYYNYCNKFDLIIWVDSHLSIYNKCGKMDNFESIQKKLIFDYENNFKYLDKISFVTDNITKKCLTKSKLKNNYLIIDNDTTSISKVLDFLYPEDIKESDIKESDDVDGDDKDSDNPDNPDKNWEVSGVK